MAERAGLYGAGAGDGAGAREDMIEDVYGDDDRGGGAGAGAVVIQPPSPALS